MSRSHSESMSASAASEAYVRCPGSGDPDAVPIASYRHDHDIICFLLLFLWSCTPRMRKVTLRRECGGHTPRVTWPPVGRMPALSGRRPRPPPAPGRRVVVQLWHWSGPRGAGAELIRIFGHGYRIRIRRRIRIFEEARDGAEALRRPPTDLSARGLRPLSEPVTMPATPKSHDDANENYEVRFLNTTGVLFFLRALNTSPLGSTFILTCAVSPIPTPPLHSCFRRACPAPASTPSTWRAAAGRRPRTRRVTPSTTRCGRGARRRR